MIWKVYQLSHTDLRLREVLKCDLDTCETMKFPEAQRTKSYELQYSNHSLECL